MNKIKIKKSEQKCENCKFGKEYSNQEYNVMQCVKNKKIQNSEDWCAMWKLKK